MEKGQGIAEHRWIGFVVFKGGDLGEIIIFLFGNFAGISSKREGEVALY